MVSPAGSGKTIISAAALNAVLLRKPRASKVRIGWLANTREQIDQAKSAIQKFPLVGAQDVKLACAAAQTDWSDRDVLVCDEVHHMIAPSWASQIATCQGARWGFTATPGTTAEWLALERELFGERFTIARKEVQSNLSKAVVRWSSATDPDLRQPIDQKINSDLKWRRRFWKGSEDQLWGQVAWQACVSLGIVDNQARNNAAIAAATNDKPTLVLVNQVEHGRILSDAIPGAVPCHSGMGEKKRASTIEAFRAGQIRCLVATKMLEEGFDAPNAEVMVMVCGGKSARAVEQSTGRVLRAFAGKTHGVIHDFRDLYHPLPAKHAREREALYLRLGYTIA